MEETVAAYRDRWLAAEGAPARWGLRLSPRSRSSCSSHRRSQSPPSGSNLTVEYLAWDTPRLLRRPAQRGSIRRRRGRRDRLVPLPASLPPGPRDRSGQLPWPVFLFGWTALLTAAAVTMLRRVPRRYRTMWPLLLVPGRGRHLGGQHQPVPGPRGGRGADLARSAWAGLALTKVTPGVGALWHGFRGRWPEFGLAVDRVR